MSVRDWLLQPPTPILAENYLFPSPPKVPRWILEQPIHTFQSIVEPTIWEWESHQAGW